MLAAALLVVPVAATQTEPAEETTPVAPVEIRTPEELQLIAQNPAGSYVLMNDLNMEGISWKSLDFNGSFDGNGHTIYNLTLSEPGDARPDSVDGNKKKYETSYVGLFGTLQDAAVKNLTLMGLKGLVESDEPCFLGGIAGYMYDTTITNCTVSGILELRAHDRMFGVAGIAGFGRGTIENCNVDVTLICTDTDQEKRDEQFMGGILATGFATIRNCNVKIDGYCSEYGYCHNGGLVGMLAEYPRSKWTAEILDNTITGKITFFEKNSDRRAYCKGVIGENIAHACRVRHNEEEFLRDERREYDVELRPEMCREPVYVSVTIPQTCDTFGYTSHTCEGCGYAYVDSYTLPEHIPGEWTLTKEPTVEETGVWTATCPCGQEFRKEEPKLDPPPTTEPEPTEPETHPVETEPVEEKSFDTKPVVALGVVLAVLLVIVSIRMFRRKK
jgi:hypothetical protein